MTVVKDKEILSIHIIEVHKKVCIMAYKKCIKVWFKEDFPQIKRFESSNWEDVPIFSKKWNRRINNKTSLWSYWKPEIKESFGQLNQKDWATLKGKNNQVGFRLLNIIIQL